MQQNKFHETKKFRKTLTFSIRKGFVFSRKRLFLCKHKTEKIMEGIKILLKDMETNFFK